MSSAIALVLLLPPTFEANSTLLVKESRSQPTFASEDKDSAFRTSEEVINSEVAILQSSYLRLKVFETLGTDVFDITPTPPTTFFAKFRSAVVHGIKETYHGFQRLLIRLMLLDKKSPLEQALATLDKNLTVAPLRKANVIELKLRSRNPKATAKVLNTLVAFYLDRHNELHQTSGAYEFFRAQATRLQQQLEASEERLRDFQKQKGLVSLDEQKSLLLKQIADITVGLERAHRQESELTARIHKIKNTLIATPQSIKWSETRERNPLLDSIGKRLVDLQQQREKLLARFLPDARQVQDINQEIRQLKKMQSANKVDLVGSTTSGQNATYKELEKMLATDEVSLAALQASQQDQKEALQDYQTHLQTLTDQAVELKHLTREVNNYQTDYEIYRKKLEEKRIELEMDRQQIVQVSVIDPAMVPLSPIRPKKSLTLLIAIPIGLVVGCLFAFGAERYEALCQKEDEQIEGGSRLPISEQPPIT